MSVLVHGLFPGSQLACQGVTTAFVQLCFFLHQRRLVSAFAMVSLPFTCMHKASPPPAPPPPPTKGHNTTYTTNGHIRVITVSPG